MSFFIQKIFQISIYLSLIFDIEFIWISRYHEVVDHIENYEPPKTTCPHCDKNFYSDRYLKYHITNEHKTNLKVLIEDESECAITITVPVVEGALPNLEMFCESCNYKTSNRKYWDRHLKGHNSININIKDMIVGCNFCDFNTNHEDSLEGHVATKNIHENEKSMMIKKMTLKKMI